MQPPNDNQFRKPRHIAIIMDGNGRWAQQHGRRRHTGHRAGVKATRAIVESCAKQGVEVLTLFAFSSENWKRPREEVTGLMSLFLEVLEREVNALDENGIRLRFIGDHDQLPDGLKTRLRDAANQTSGNKRMVLMLAVAYGGRWDVVQAAQQIAKAAGDGAIAPDAVDDKMFSQFMSLNGLPSPDLLIRTGGEKRISNFLLWDLAYTELYFVDTLWPDFGLADLELALQFYADRERRFGQTGDQLEVSIQ